MIGGGGFVKVYDSILLSSVWQEDGDTFKVWMALLLLADKNGFVEGAVPGLAGLAKVPLEAVEAALAKFAAPDDYSKTKANEGRRIRAIEGGWLVLNKAAYRDRRTGAEVDEPAAASGGNSYVYYVQDGAEIKIGASKNPWARLRDIRTSRPNAVLVATERGDRSKQLLRYEQFGRPRIVGEGGWLALTPEISAFVDNLVAGGADSSSDVATVVANASLSSSPSKSVVVDLKENGSGENSSNETAAWAVTTFVAAHDFGPYARDVEGLLRSSRAPVSIMGILTGHMQGIDGPQYDARHVGRAVQQFNANSTGGGFSSAYFAGFLRRVKGATAQRREDEEIKQHDARRRDEQADEDRAAADRRRAIADFETQHPERYGELAAMAEEQTDKKITRGRGMVVKGRLVELILAEVGA